MTYDLRPSAKAQKKQQPKAVKLAASGKQLGRMGGHRGVGRGGSPRQGRQDAAVPRFQRAATTAIARNWTEEVHAMAKARDLLPPTAQDAALSCATATSASSPQGRRLDLLRCMGAAETGAWIFIPPRAAPIVARWFPTIVAPVQSLAASPNQLSSWPATGLHRIRSYSLRARPEFC